MIQTQMSSQGHMDNKANSQQVEVFDRLSKGNKLVLYFYRKTTKICSATYMVSDLIKDTEPLKWQLRKYALAVVSIRNFLSDQAVFYTLEEGLLELDALLELAKVSRTVSDMNAYLLQNEIRKLLGEIKERSKEGFYIAELGPNFFETPKPAAVSFEELLASQTPNRPEENYKGHKRQDVRYDFYNTKSTPESNRASLPVITPNSDQKGHRKDEILKIVRAGGSVIIKDITESIKDCSEKTIQRELISLVDQGILKRTGERRWSRYSLPK